MFQIENFYFLSVSPLINISRGQDMLYNAASILSQVRRWVHFLPCGPLREKGGKGVIREINCISPLTPFTLIPS